MPLDPYSGMINRLKNANPTFRKAEGESFVHWQERTRTRLAQLLGVTNDTWDPNLDE